MKLTLLAVSIYAASMSAVFAGIDFTPKASEFVLAGIKATHLNFKQEDKIIKYAPPAGWPYAGDAARIKFTPTGVAQAHAEIDQVPLPEARKLDEAVLLKLQQQAAGFAGEGASDVAVVASEKNPFLVNNNETYEVTLSYRAFGQEFMMSVLYVNLPDTELRFRVKARKDDFEKVRKTFRGSIFTWQWTPQKAAATSRRRYPIPPRPEVRVLVMQGVRAAPTGSYHGFWFQGSGRKSCVRRKATIVAQLTASRNDFFR